MLRLRNGWPMPLMLQGVFEILQSVVFVAAILLVPLIAVYFSGGFSEESFETIMQFGGLIWLAVHGVPIQIHNLGPETDPSSVSGWFTLIPLGLSLIPLFFAMRAGRRIARASYTDQLWQGLLGAFTAYGWWAWPPVPGQQRLRVGQRGGRGAAAAGDRVLRTAYRCPA